VSRYAGEDEDYDDWDEDYDPDGFECDFCGQRNCPGYCNVEDYNLPLAGSEAIPEGGVVR
jgi:hypothetical protein